MYGVKQCVSQRMRSLIPYRAYLKNGVRPQRNKRMGTTVLEVMTATVVATMLLIPTATMLSDAGRWSNRMEQQTELISLLNSCVSEIEFELAANFQSNKFLDNFKSRGSPNSYYFVRCVDDTAEGGIPGNFMIIQALGWVDQNGNASWDQGEPKQELNSGLAKRG